MPSAPANPWLGRRVISYAHQGGAWEAPSSTLFAIRRALELGATGIELDVHATADGELVVSHDGTVDRTTNGAGAIHQLTLAEIRELDNAYWFVPGSRRESRARSRRLPLPGPGPRGPRFRHRHPGRGAGPARRAPQGGRQPRHQGHRTGGGALRGGAGRLPGRARHLDRVIVASFLDAATAAFSRWAPAIATSAGTLGVAGFWRALTQGGEFPAAGPRGPAGAGLLRRAGPGRRKVRDRGPRAGSGRPRLDHQRREGDGPTARPGRGRDHLGSAHGPGGAAGGNDSAWRP